MIQAVVLGSSGEGQAEILCRSASINQRLLIWFQCTLCPRLGGLVDFRVDQTTNRSFISKVRKAVVYCIIRVRLRSSKLNDGEFWCSAVVGCGRKIHLNSTLERHSNRATRTWQLYVHMIYFRHCWAQCVLVVVSSRYRCEYPENRRLAEQEKEIKRTNGKRKEL